MILISHRGNIDNIKPEMENRLEYIQAAIDAGYEVEVDVWVKDGRFFLGHDGPQYEFDPAWMYARNDKLWVHTKNFTALRTLIDSNLRIFFHEQEKHTIIHNCKLIWSHNLEEADEKSIIPLLSLESLMSKYEEVKVYGICSDYVGILKKYWRQNV